MREPETTIGGQETAIFRGDDPDCIVAAALACRVCLSGDVEWGLEPEPWDASVVCRCRRCDHERRVSLTPDQALRLSLHGPRVPAAPELSTGLALIA